jgi:ubiquinone/menaquinone biosynthesis C-methylase UbiE
MEPVTSQIYTRSGVTKVPLRCSVLHIGCGENKIPGAVGMDRFDTDVTHDLEQIPWPFEDNSFDVVVAHSVLEHLTPFVSIMEEIHRVCKDRVVICVPYFRSLHAYHDPTHIHFFTHKSMDCVLENAPYHYTDKRFKLVGFWYGWPQPSRNPVAKLFKSFIHAYPDFYEQYLSILPVQALFWELSKI